LFAFEAQQQTQGTKSLASPSQTSVAEANDKTVGIPKPKSSVAEANNKLVALTQVKLSGRGLHTNGV